MNGEDKEYNYAGHKLTKKDLLTMDTSLLRTLLLERTHHTIETFIYRIIAGKRKILPNFGDQVKVLLDIWEERGLRTDTRDIQWCKNYLKWALEIREGKTPNIEGDLYIPFSNEKMKVVEELIFKRRSIREWTDKKVPKDLIKRIIEAGLYAPNACNMNNQRFLIVDEPGGLACFKGDVPWATLRIAICQIESNYEFIGVSKTNPKNLLFDAGAVADHMSLMAHALGLGAVWITPRENEVAAIKEYYKLPDNIKVQTAIALGWPAEAPIKSERITVEEAILDTQVFKK
jgi:nitroreductase